VFFILEYDVIMLISLAQYRESHSSLMDEGSVTFKNSNAFFEKDGIEASILTATIANPNWASKLGSFTEAAKVFNGDDLPTYSGELGTMR
jgi:hypothetical protein